MFVLPVSSSLHRRALRGVGVVPSFAHLLGSRPCGVAADASGAEPRVPSMDVLESDTAYTVVLDAPGVTKEQLQVSVEGRRVSISTAATAAPETAKESVDAPASDAPTQRVLYRERSAASYARTVVLPAEVDQSASQARFENGVLTLTLGKRVASGATKIAVS